MKLYLYLALGGAAGVLLRFALGSWIGGLSAATSFPIGTLVINVAGSFLLGFLMRYLRETEARPDVTLMLTTGLCGGFTTFSTFSYEAVALLSDRQYATAALYGTSSLVASVVACWLGLIAAELVLRR
jgi:fluoride exporter